MLIDFLIYFSFSNEGNNLSYHTVNSDVTTKLCPEAFTVFTISGGGGVAIWCEEHVDWRIRNLSGFVMRPPQFAALCIFIHGSRFLL